MGPCLAEQEIESAIVKASDETSNAARLADPILAEHVANTTAVLTDRGMKVTRSKHGSTRPNVAAVAMVRAIAMAMLEPPPPPRPRVIGSFR